MHIGKHQIEREQDVFLDEETLFSNQSNDECTFLEGTNLLPIENISPFLDENPNNYGIEIDQHMSDSNHQHTDLTTCTTSTLLDFTNITVNIDENFRDLPPGMKYHFYVSYSSDDSSIVNKIIEELEERFFFKCLNFERDFTPGRRIDQLINEEMNQSEAVLIILSHTYTEKLWCLAEAQLAFEMSFKTNNKIKVIPILIHPLTEELPTILKSIRYIDAEKEEDVAARIHEIYRNPAVMNVHCLERTADESTQNGASIWTFDAKLHSHCGMVYISNFQELTHENKEKLNSFGDNCADQVHAVMSYVNSHTLTRVLAVLRFGRQSACVLFFIFLIFVGVVLALGSLIIILKGSTERYGSMIWILFSAFGIGFTVSIISAVFGLILRVKLAIHIRTGIWNINSQYYESSNCLIEFLDYNNGPIISVVRYDTSKCKEYLCVLLERRSTSYDEEDRKELVHNLIEEKLKELQIALFCNWSTMEESYFNVHNTWKNRKCLCQILEKRLPSTKEISEH